MRYDESDTCFLVGLFRGYDIRSVHSLLSLLYLNITGANFYFGKESVHLGRSQKMFRIFSSLKIRRCFQQRLIILI